MHKLIFQRVTKYIFVVGMIFILLFSISCSKQPSLAAFDADKARQKMNEALLEVVTDENGEINRNAVMMVDAPDYNFTFANAAGIAREDTGEAMTVDHQFTIASVGKTMTAVMIMQMLEEGSFGEKGLDVTLDELHVFPQDVLDELHKINGVSYGRQITLRHLLNQTSGLKDVLMDDENGLGEDSPAEYRGYAPGSLNGLIVFDAEKGFEAMLQCVRQGIPAGCKPEDYYLSYTWPHWDEKAWRENPDNKMAGLLNFYLSGMNETALWQPGTDFHYADTNYILLGLIIEELSGNSLHQELRTRIFDPLGMDHTYLAYATQPETAPWEGRHSDHWGSETALISNGINLSNDWGAGGEVSTVADLNIFIRALAEGRLFRQQSTLQEMLKLPQDISQPFYAAGIIFWDTGDGYILHHNGAPGCWIEYHSASNITITGTINDLDHPHHFLTLRGEIYNALAEAGVDSFNFKSGTASMGLLNLLNGSGSPVILPILLLSFIFFPVTLITWLIAGLRKSKQQSKPAAAARWTAAAAMLVNLVFMIGLVLTIAKNPVQLMFGFNASMLMLLSLPLISLLLTGGVIICTVMAWKNSYWNLAGRIHYALTGTTLLAFLWVIYILQI